MDYWKSKKISKIIIYLIDNHNVNYKNAQPVEVGHFCFL